MSSTVMMKTKSLPGNESLLHHYTGNLQRKKHGLLHRCKRILYLYKFGKGVKSIGGSTSSCCVCKASWATTEQVNVVTICGLDKGTLHCNVPLRSEDSLRTKAVTISSKRLHSSIEDDAAEQSQ